jgi:hypothetical protein
MAHIAQQHAYVHTCMRGRKEDYVPRRTHTHAARHNFFHLEVIRRVCEIISLAEEKADVFKKEKDFFILPTVVCGSGAAGVVLHMKFKMPFDLLFNYDPFLAPSLLLLITSTCWQ